MAVPSMNGKSNGKKALATQQSVNDAVWGICDIMRRSNCAGALQYVPELTWILFLRILDEKEADEEDRAAVVGADFAPSIEAPYRWRDWAAKDGAKRKKLDSGHLGDFFRFVNGELLPYLRGLRSRAGATPRQRIIGQVLTGTERVRMDTERPFLDVLDRVHQLSANDIDATHTFALSQVYEGLLLKMGEKGNDGGQFFTPRQVIQAMVQVVDPKLGDSVYDPCCGTGGFLAQACSYMLQGLGNRATPASLDVLARRTFYGREKEDMIYPIALANLILHGVDEPHIWHGNTLTGGESDGSLPLDTEARYEVILTNPPFGGKEAKDVQINFDFRTNATEVLFLQHVLSKLKPGGRCGIVLPEGVLFKTNEAAFTGTKRRLLNDCDLYCIVSLPGGVFTAAGAGVKTNLLFFTKGQPTERIWYYDLSDVKVGKKTPLTLANFADFFRLLPSKANSERSWTVTRDEIEARNYDLKAVNPNAKTNEDTRTPAELLDLIEAKGREVAEALAVLRNLK